MKRIVWLASFPKSGNTWMRLLLANYFHDSVDINAIGLDRIASGRSLFDEWSVVDSSDLTDDEVLDSRGDLYRSVARHASTTLYFRTHDAWTVSRSGKPVYPSDVTIAVIYLVRHPFDVAVSMSHYLGLPLPRVVSLMGDDRFAFNRDAAGISIDFPQPVMSWHRNVSSWVNSGLPMALVRYEDLRQATMASLTTVLQRIGDPADPVRVRRAVELTDFGRLQQEEAARGFRERWPASTAFFRGGRIGDGHRDLPIELQQTLAAQHAPMMRVLGYL